MSAMIIASPVVTPFTTMTVYAEDLEYNDEEIETNEGTVTDNNGTIGTNANRQQAINFAKDNGIIS